MNLRQKETRETWQRLLNWDKGSSPAERLSGQIIRAEGFSSIDPSHPLGGPDGLKDILCIRDSIKYFVAAYFPRGQQRFAQIKAKFINDIKCLELETSNGFVFVTNQEVKLRERDALTLDAGVSNVEIYHLERISSILNFPTCYGIRLEFLDIEMSKEEQLSFMALQQVVLTELQDSFAKISRILEREQENSNTHKTPVVMPEFFPLNLYPNLVNPPRIHECITCKGIYIVNPYCDNSKVYINAIRVITCPYCGRKDKF